MELSGRGFNPRPAQELCLVPQIYNACRFGVDLSPLPRVMRVHDARMKNRAFREAAPENQPDCDI